MTRFAVALVACFAAVGLGVVAGAEEPSEDAAPPAQAEAAAPAVQPSGVEIDSKRTAVSKTFRLSNGALETRVYTSPVHFRDAGGEWRPIDEDLRAVESVLSNGANSFDVDLPNRMGSAPVRLTTDEEWVAFELLGPATEPVEAAGNVASYEGADPGVSFELSSLANGLKEDIVIADASQPRSFSFELTASPGVAPHLRPDGSIEFAAADGETVAVVPAPVMSDSSPGRPEVSNEVEYEIESQGDSAWRLTIDAAGAWLAEPARVWPVTLDPTVTLPSPSLDCTFGYYGTGPSVWGACGSGGYQKLYADLTPALSGGDEGGRSAVRFNLSSIPSNAHVTSATAGLYAPSSSYNTSGVELRRATKDWTSAVNWSKYNSTSLWTKAGGDFSSEGAAVSTAQRGNQAGWWSFSDDDFTTLVDDWVTGKVANQGLVVKLQDDESRVCGPTSCTDRGVYFNSSAVADSSKRPYLSLTYYLPAPNNGGGVSRPMDGLRTSRFVPLQLGTKSDAESVTFQVRDGQRFKTIPAYLVRDSKGDPVTWPYPVKEGETDLLSFDAASYSGLAGSGPGTEVYVRALVDGGPLSAGYTPMATAVLDRYVGGPRDAFSGIGPGSVNLETGNFTISRTDVSIAGFGSALEFSRSIGSRNPGVEKPKLNDPATTNVLGQGWQPSSPVEAAGGAEWQRARDANAAEEGPYVVLTDLEGYEYAFEQVGAGYASPPELPEWLLARQDATHLALTDPDGNRTIFEKEASGYDYLPKAVSQTGGSGNTTRMVYQLANGKRRLSMMIAPTASEVTCPEATATTTVGCRVLTFTYQPATTWGAPSSYGDRLSSIKYHGPASATTMSSWEVARYAYNSSGQMTEAWDPRISPALKEKYTYEGLFIRTLTPAGEEPWTFDYYPAVSGEEFGGRLKSVSRPTLLSSPSTAQTTLVYDVPLSGAGAPYDMSATAVGKWGQTDIPADATAIFPPDQVPASPPSSYSRASVHYTDYEGQLVNTATPSGAGTEAPSIVTSEADEHGNVLRELSAQNRLRALAAGANSVARSHELETRRVFDRSGSEMQEEWGPQHEVRLESGETVQAVMHRTVKYDEGAPSPPPAGTPQYHLPTRETVGALPVGQETDVDVRVTETKYNWTLRKPTDTIVDPSGLNLRTHIEYDATTGLPTERRLPANPNGGDARTTKFRYYNAKAHTDPTCANRPGWAGMLCKTYPAAQPNTPGQPALLVTAYSNYNAWGQPGLVSASPADSGQNAQTTTTTFDAAGRPTKVTQGGGGTAIPATETLYSATTGRPVTQRFACSSSCESFDNQALTTTYDTLGRPTAYQDADGNTSTTTYDFMSRPVEAFDGKGTQTYGYDPTSGLLVSLTDSAAGTFTAKYDANGGLVEQTLPNGLVAETTYDETGAPVHLAYEKTTNCFTNCTWLDFDVAESIHGQWLEQSSGLSTQQYSYDKAGRLTLVKDTPQGGGCTTRAYSYDANSNRKSLTTRTPGAGGVCDTTSTGTVQNYSYDPADRLTGTGIVYDNYGRITTLPSAYSGGGTLTTSYFVNDLVRSQTQDGITNTYELDSALRQRQRVQTGSKSGTEIYHYAGGSDSPVWIDRGSGWSRNIASIGGGLGAIQDSASGVTLQLTNLHGDIVATASPSAEATKLLGTFESDEFGNPKQVGPAKYAWLGGKQRRTELSSGVVQMGVRSYVPAMGRFTSVDPVLGGSANSYEYGMGDPINMFDLDGRASTGTACFADSCTCYFSVSMTSRRRGHMRIRMSMRCARAGTKKVGGWTKYEKHRKGDHCFVGVCDHFEPWTPRVVVPEGSRINAAGCRDCGRNWDFAFTTTCEPGREYQVVKMHQVLLGWGPKGGQEVSKVVKAQEYCAS